MALHRVASIESWDRASSHLDAGPGASGSPFAHRKMSFNPIDGLVSPAEPEQLTAASQVSSVKRIGMLRSLSPEFAQEKRDWLTNITVQITVACIYCLFAAGTVFGFAALKPVLVREGVYGQLCKKKEGHGEEDMCIAQEIRLNLMFTTAAVATNISALPVGTILDRYGPRVCGLIGSLLLTVGSCLIIFVDQLPFDGYLPGYLFLAMGGPYIYISSFHLSNCFPRHSGLILAMLTGSFDSSSALFLIYRIAYDASGETFTPQNLFTLFLVIPLFIVIMQFFVMPQNSYKTIGEIAQGAENPAAEDQAMSPEHDDPSDSATWEQRRRASVLDETTPLMGEYDKAREQEEHKKRITGVWGALHGLSARKQILTPWWILIALFTTIQMTRINYFVATIRTQYAFLFQSHAKAEQVNNLFDVSLPVAGIVAIPFIGLILDNLSTPASLGVLVGTATAIGLLGVMPYMWAAYLNVILFTLYRPLYYTGISDYSAKVFGFQTFGKVYGLIICVAGLFNFVQSGFDTLTHGPFNDDPRPINWMLLLVGLAIGGCLVIYVQKQRVRMQKSGTQIAPGN